MLSRRQRVKDFSDAFLFDFLEIMKKFTEDFVLKQLSIIQIMRQ